MALVSAGSNAEGQLANGTLDDTHTFSAVLFENVPHDDQLHVTSVALGANHTLALVQRISPDADAEATTELWCSGDGSHGQLGPAYLNAGPLTSFKPLDILSHRPELGGYSCRLVAAAWQTSYMVFSAKGKPDIFVSMGSDDFGDLGTGLAKKSKGSIHILTFDASIPKEATFTSIAAGPHHVLVSLRTPDAAWVVGWGGCRHGQLGTISNETKRPPSSISQPQIIRRLQDVISISSGSQHSIILDSFHQITVLGSNKKGQLQVESETHIYQVGCTWNGTYLVSDSPNSFIIATGSHSKGQLGRAFAENSGVLPPGPVQFPFTPRTHQLKKLACGTEHVLALFEVSDVSRSEVWAWGWNEHGNLGLGNTSDVMLPTRIWPRLGTEGLEKKALDIWAGAGTSWIHLK